MSNKAIDTLVAELTAERLLRINQALDDFDSPQFVPTRWELIMLRDAYQERDGGFRCALTTLRATLVEQLPTNGTFYHCSSCSCHDCRNALEDCVCRVRAEVQAQLALLDSLEALL